MQLPAYRAQGTHCLGPRALALREGREVAAVAPDAIRAFDGPALHLQSEHAAFRQDDDVGLAPDLALVAAEPERVEHDPGLRKVPPEALVDVALAVRAVLGDVRDQDGQLVPPTAPPK